ncbi:hypothetical protein GCM10009835_19230 [Planosporangium flavigriseum]|uniref:DUF4097 domain-containing protein n=1 Tax=Planosporangium flavigriseum TaxID=373681 RepID=A0A8J3PLJ9_9ACTN|nr:hypothetical protein Pfl04_03550 [Planosporangium flavigriseum]
MGGIGVLAVATLGGCNVGAARNEFRDERTVEGAIGTVAIAGGAGSVTVSGSSDGSIRVKRHIFYRDNRPGATDSVKGDTLTLNTDCGRVCWVDYEVTAPRGIRVTGHNGSGDVALSDVASVSLDIGSGEVRIRRVAGDVAVSAGSGDLDLSDVAGSVAGRTGSGNVRVAGAAGATTLDTGSGDIDARDLRGPRTTAHTGSGNATLALTSAQDVNAETGSGDVRITVPGGQSYQVAATTDSGDSHVRVPTDPAAKNRIKLRTDSGNVTVEQR